MAKSDYVKIDPEAKRLGRLDRQVGKVLQRYGITLEDLIGMGPKKARELNGMGMSCLYHLFGVAETARSLSDPQAMGVMCRIKSFLDRTGLTIDVVEKMGPESLMGVKNLGNKSILAIFDGTGRVRAYLDKQQKLDMIRERASKKETR